MAGLMVLGGCGGPSTTLDKAGRDLEIERDLKVLYNEDPRWENVWPKCRKKKVTLEGWVMTERDAWEAWTVAKKMPGVGEVESKLEVRER